MSEAIWHDLECGRYQEDLSLWLDLAKTYGGPVLDIGAGTGRVALALARAGFEVTAMDLEAALLAELNARSGALPIETVTADARDFTLAGRTFPLILLPMQTLQLLGGTSAHIAFMRRAQAHLAPGGAVAVAIAVADDFEEFEWRDGDSAPLPDTGELDGYLYSSQPTLVRRDGDAFVLARRRDTVAPDGARTTTDDRLTLDIVSASEVEDAGEIAGLHAHELRQIPPTMEHIGSQVVVLHG